MREKTHAIWNPWFLSQIIDSMAEGVFTLDPQGRISSWNRAMEIITGYTSKEALGHSCSLLGVSRCFGKICPANIQECGILRHGQTEAKECVLRHKKGFDVPVIKQARAVKDDHDQIIGVVETVTDMTELERARKKVEEASKRLGEVYQLGNIIGKSQKMTQVFSAIKAAATSKATVLIQGESGTGKELVAGAIHCQSPMSQNSLVTVNCSALPESLLESELFGHVRGAFTGAVRDRVGRFEEADGGTIFLDEIGELSPYIQIKLLRVLQEKEIERVGDSKKRQVDIRIIVATNQKIKAMVEQGTFREDLYYRLKVFPIFLPPLRERKEDIPLLVNHFIQNQNQKTGKEIQGLEPQAMRIIMDYWWPGNVRELENAIEHAFVLSIGRYISPMDLPLEIRQQIHKEEKEKYANNLSKNQLELSLDRNYLWQLLKESNWNKAEVGRRLGLSRTSVWKYMKKFKIPLKKDEAINELK